MLRYVGEEVERVKELFEQKERRLIDEAQAAAAAAATEASHHPVANVTTHGHEATCEKTSLPDWQGLTGAEASYSLVGRCKGLLEEKERRLIDEALVPATAAANEAHHSPIGRYLSMPAANGQITALWPVSRMHALLF